MFRRSFHLSGASLKWATAVMLLVIWLRAAHATPVSAAATPGHVTKEQCGTLDECDTRNANPVCFLDTDNACIRKYPSECHLKITACRTKSAIPEYNNDICSMESFYCEIGYERWTIFFGHENDK